MTENPKPVDDNAPMTGEVVTISRPSKSVLIDMADRYNMEPAPFEATVRATCVPPNASREEFAAFLLVAKEYRLNPLTKEIYAFPKRGGGIVPIVSIDGWISLVNSHPACDGFSFSWEQDEQGSPISCTCSMYRKDRSHPVVVTEYFAECVRPTDPWKMKHRMLRHKALIQAGRYAFGFSGIYDEDEGAKIAEAKDITPVSPPPLPPRLPPKPPAESDPASDGPNVPDEAETAAGAPAVAGSDDEVPDTSDATRLLSDIDEALKSCLTRESVDEVFNDFDVQIQFADDEPALTQAFELREQHYDRVDKIEATASDFPGDR